MMEQNNASVPPRPPRGVTLSTMSALPISVTTASYPAPVLGTNHHSVLGLKRRRTASDDGRGKKVGSGPNPNNAKEARLAAVPVAKLSRRPSIGSFSLSKNLVTNCSSTGSSSSSGSGIGSKNEEWPSKQQVSSRRNSSYSAACTASIDAQAADQSGGGSLSLASLPRNGSTQSLPTMISQKPSIAPDLPPFVEKNTETENAGKAAALQAKSSPVQAAAAPVAGKASTDQRKGLSRSVSLPSIMSPQVYLDTILKTRGYSTQNYCSLEGGYYCKPTPHQKASYGIRLVRAVRASDSDLLRSLLRAGLSRNPCNSFGESIVHMVCRRGDYELLRVMVDEGCSLQVSDDFGRTPLHDACWTATPDNFRVVDLILRADPRLLRIVDCRGSSPLSYVKRDHWDRWVEYLEDRKDEFWPVRDAGGKDGPEGPPPLSDAAPHSRPVRDPPGAAPPELAAMVASGQVEPDEAMRRMGEFREDVSAQEQKQGGATDAGIKPAAAPIAAA